MKKIIVLLIAIVMTSVVAKEITPGIVKNDLRTKKKKSIKVAATYYNPIESQCDLDPLTTASNSKINLKKLKAGKIRWIACSRDLLKRWGGTFNYGDKVYITSKNKNVDGYWIIKDSMNKRYKNRIDFLCYDKIKGDISTVLIRKIE